jgi:hypothetical protein
MVINQFKHTRRPLVPQGSPEVASELNKIAAKTPFNFSGKNLTPYSGLLPVATMLEKLGFKKLVEETLSVHRIPRVMTIYQFLLGMVQTLYVGFSRLSHLRFVAQDPMLTGCLAGRAAAPAIHLLAISGITAFASSQATAGPAARAAPARVGSRQCAAGHGHSGH